MTISGESLRESGTALNQTFEIILFDLILFKMNKFTGVGVL